MTDFYPVSLCNKPLMAMSTIFLCVIAPLAQSDDGHDHGTIEQTHQPEQPLFDPVMQQLHIPVLTIANQDYQVYLRIRQTDPVIWELQSLTPLPQHSESTDTQASYDSETGIATIPQVEVPGRGRFNFRLSLLPGTTPVQLSMSAVEFPNLLTPSCSLWTADRLFDGITLQENKTLLIEGNTVQRVGSFDELQHACSYRVNLGNATLMPGFIESHAHLTFQNVDADTVLKHGVTTVRDTGGPLLAPQGGDGRLRILSAGPIIQAAGGYPLNVFGGSGGYDSVGIVAHSTDEARTIVRHLIEGGAEIIKIALEPGGESGAPWSYDHGHGAPPAAPWPMLSQDIVEAIVAEAHAYGKKVTAHIGENEGATLALAAGVDEWAHIPCAAVDDALLQQAVEQGVTFVTTVDTLSSCQGIYVNLMKLGDLLKTATSGAQLIYGSEIGHDNVPWGINAQELHLLLHMAGMTPQAIFQAATAKAGEHLDRAPLGTLTAGAPADMIAVRGNPFTRFKPLEYPDLVMSGGRVVVNRFTQ
ncbi:MAG: hypothetical protein Kow0065_04160 [Methylomicrobium sp.]